MNPLKDYLKTLTHDEVLLALIKLAAAIGLPTTAWKTGDQPKGVLSILAGFIVSTWNAAILPVLSVLFLDYAYGPLFRVAARVFWGVEPKSQTYASGKLTVENRDVIPQTISPEDLAAKNATTGKVFRNVTGGFLAARSGSGPYPTLELDYEAVEIGSASNTLAGQIQEEPVQAPAGVYFLPNAAPLLGQDEETDEELKVRIRASVGALSPAGPRAAYEFVALSTRVPGVPAGTEDGRSLRERLLVSMEGDVAVNVNRVRVVSNGTVQVWLASPAGAASGNVATPGTDVYLVNQAIQILVVPAGITATVGSASELAITASLDVRILRESNLSEAAASAAIDAALAQHFRTHPVGGRKLVPGGQGWFLMEELKGIVKAAAPGIYYVDTGATDGPMADNEVAVSLVTYTLTTVTQGS